MIRGSRPKICHWCDRAVPAVGSLYVNGHGWTPICSECDGIAQDAVGADQQVEPAPRWRKRG